MGKKNLEETVIVPIVLIGGKGRRLWPITSAKSPKHLIYIKRLIPFISRSNLLTNTMDNLKLIKSGIIQLGIQAALKDPIIVCNEQDDYIDIRSNIRLAGGFNSHEIIVSEPYSKNTASAIELACLAANKVYKNKNVIHVVVPVDHVIKQLHNAFGIAVAAAIQKAINYDNIIAIGTPIGTSKSLPDRDKGYINIKDHLGTNLDTSIISHYDINGFIEKPCDEYLKSIGSDVDNLWFVNTGIYAFKLGVYMNELNKCDETMYTTVLNSFEHGRFTEQKITEVKHVGKVKVKSSLHRFNVTPDDSYRLLKDDKTSIDYVVMSNKSVESKVVIGNYDWMDAGSWKSIFDNCESNTPTKNLTFIRNKNLTEENVFYIDAKSNLVVDTDVDKDPKIGVIGLNNIVIVKHDDKLLVASRKHLDKVESLSKYFGYQ